MAQPIWSFKFSPECEKEWDKLDQAIQARILNFIYKRMIVATNPRVLARPLSGQWKDLWRFRIGDYRLICSIRDHELLILAAHVGHRSKVYQAAHRFKSFSS